MNTQIEYVVGFLFSDDGKQVVLIEKKKPAWQKGKWNGVGGKVEAEDEDFPYAITREFEEETGLYIEPFKWQYFARVEGEWRKLHCLTARCAPLMRPPLAQTEAERPEWHTVDLLSGIPTIPNLRWIIPLALDHTSGFVVCQDVVVNNTPELSTS